MLPARGRYRYYENIHTLKSLLRRLCMDQAVPKTLPSAAWSDRLGGGGGGRDPAAHTLGPHDAARNIA